MIRTLPAAIAATLLTVVPAAARPAPATCDQPALAEGTYVDINVDIPGAEAITLSAINERGDIVGWGSGPLDAPVRSFLLRRGTVTPIVVPGAEHTWAHDINAAGVVTGTYADPEGSHVFTWRDGAFTLSFPAVEEEQRPSFTAINNAGAIAGSRWFSVGNTLEARGFVLRGDRLMPIETGFPFSFPAGLNERGDVLLRVQPSSPGPGRGSYVLATRGGVHTVSGCPGLDDFQGILRAITNQRQLVGRMGSFTAFRGVVYSEKDGVTAYDYPGAISTELVDMNSAGYAIGHAGITDFILTQPFLFIPHGR